ncbi:Pyridoxamine 5'-phosphate oxidase [Geoalkalibacter ferrihydriticus]|nr:Pyridoxamine 5'-phosphate oxidase [Geoalkalibacter ferrihydriticus]
MEISMDDTLQKLIHELLQQQNLGVLATSAAGHPYTTLVGFAATADMKQLLFATHRATRKYANLSVDQRVSLLIDNRSNRAEDFRIAAALTAFGTAREVPAEEQDGMRAIFFAKHPMLKEFVSSPGCALCRISVQRYSLVRRFQDVMELVLDGPDPCP